MTEYELLIELRPDGSNLITLFKALYYEQTLCGYWSDYSALNSAESKFLFLVLTETDEPYIDFSEDGSLSALMDREYQGIYYLSSVSENAHGDEFTRISFELVSQDAQSWEGNIYSEMYYYPDGLANAFRVYLNGNYEDGGLKYSGIYFFRKS